MRNHSVEEILARRKDIGGTSATVTKIAKAPSSWNAETRTAHFVMSSQSTDRHGDIVVIEGLDTTEFEKNPVALAFHDSRSWPIGTWSNLEKHLTGRPKRLEGDLTLLPEGGPIKAIEEAAWMIANGGVRACSIGFVPDWDDYELIRDAEGVWTGGIKWNRASLVECSIVPVPANTDAMAKSGAAGRDLIEDILDNWAKSPDGVLMPRADFEQAYRIIPAETEAEPGQPSIPVKELLQLRLRRLAMA